MQTRIARIALGVVFIAWVAFSELVTLRRSPAIGKQQISIVQIDRNLDTLAHMQMWDDSKTIIANVSAPAAVRSSAASPASVGLSNAVRYVFCQHPSEAPAWAVRYGKEFWRRPKTDRRGHQRINNATAPSVSLPASIDLGDVIERVSYALTNDDSTPRVKAATYEASFEADTLSFRPFRPQEPAHSPDGLEEDSVSSADDPQPAAVFRTVAVRFGSRTVYAAGEALPIWSVLGNTAQALLEQESGLVTHYEASREGI